MVSDRLFARLGHHTQVNKAIGVLSQRLARNRAIYDSIAVHLVVVLMDVVAADRVSAL